jgi:hypothetical protein
MVFSTRVIRDRLGIRVFISAVVNVLLVQQPLLEPHLLDLDVEPDLPPPAQAEHPAPPGGW